MIECGRCTFLMDNERMPDEVEAPRKKSLQEQIHELANENLLEAARAGFAEIDRHAEIAKKKIRTAGITGAESIVESVATFIKRKAAELATGREQK